jgi:dipeptidase E
MSNGRSVHRRLAGEHARARLQPVRWLHAQAALRMKLLLSSAGVTNPSIHAALVELLGKPIEESAALAIPTASYGHPGVSSHQAWKFIAGLEPRTPMVELGWKSVGILELTAVPTMDDRWISWVREADVLLANGGDSLYLGHWMRASGLADLFPSLDDKVYVGLSGGSMVMTPRIGEDFVQWKPPGGGDAALGLVDFSIFPHLDHPELPENTMADAERWAAGMPLPCYAIDDETAIRVVDGAVDVISEGHWRLFAR